MIFAKKRLKTGAEIIFLFVGVLAVLVPASPYLQRLPSWDSGVYLYNGWRVAEGALLYRDAFDNKPPLIFYVNAFGILLSNGSRWGVWGLEVIFLTIAALLAYDLLKRTYGTWTAVYISFAWLLNAFLAGDGGNYPTEYGLPLQFGILWLVGTAPEGRISIRRAIVIGILSGLLFWFKQNLAGTPFAFGLYLLILVFTTAERRTYLYALVAFAASALLTEFVVLVPFILQGALGELWAAAFLYNFDAARPLLQRFLNLRYAGVYIAGAGFSLLAVIGWLGAAMTWLEARLGGGDWFTHWVQRLDGLLGESDRPVTRTQSQTPRTGLIAVTLIAFPFELFFVGIAGRDYDHYFLALLPTGAVMAGFAFRILLNALERTWNSTRVVALFVAATVLIAAFFAIQPYGNIYFRLRTRDNTTIISFLNEHTQPTETVFIWGSEGRILFAAKRHSPTIYIYPAFRANRRGTLERANSFLDTMMQHPARYLFDPGATPDAFFNFTLVSPAVQQKAEQLLAKYEPRGTISGWKVYELRDNAK